MNTQNNVSKMNTQNNVSKMNTLNNVSKMNTLNNVFKMNTFDYIYPDFSSFKNSPCKSILPKLISKSPGTLKSKNILDTI